MGAAVTRIGFCTGFSRDGEVTRVCDDAPPAIP